MMEHELPFNDFFRKKTKDFAVRVIKYCSGLPKTEAVKIIVYQLVKAGTSTAANFRAYCRGRSAKEKYSKICIVVEEADEALFWLEVIEESDIDRSAEQQELNAEAESILSIASSVRKKFKI